MDHEWRNTFSFSDRLSVISQIAAAFASAIGVDYSEAVTKAQNLETEILNQASSQEEYTKLWKQHVEDINTPQYAIPREEVKVQQEAKKIRDKSTSKDLARIGPYFTEEIYATGITSTVYKALSTTSLSSAPEYVALKVTTPSILSPPHDPKAEALVLKRTKHPHILPLLDTFTTTATHSTLSHFVLVFPFLPYSFSTLLHHTPPLLTPSTTKSILKSILSALSHLHSHGIIHRDIKPSNILLAAPTGPAYLCDFGIAWSTPERLSTESPHDKITDVGTTSYRAPEVLFGYRSYTTALDLWSMGCVIAEAYNSPMYETFFDAGDLGSELRLIASIFQKLGTPTVESWPGSQKLPDFNKIQFREFPAVPWEELLSEAPKDVREVVSMLLRYEDSERVSAADVLKHKFWEES